MMPNWSRLENSVILLGATILYAVMAESLINTVEVILNSVEMKEEFLGIKLFPLAPESVALGAP
jgi:Ca2+:H+ antiporter